MVTGDFDVSKAEQIIELGRAVCVLQNARRAAKLREGNGDVPDTTNDIHKALTVKGVFADKDQAKKGWALLAQLADYQYPGVRIGEPAPSAWRGLKRMVRAKEWHRVPTPEEMTAWEEAVLGHRRTLAQAATGNLTARMEAVEARLAALELEALS